MKLVTTGPGNDVDLSTATVTSLCRIQAAQHFKLADRVNTGIRLDREVRSSVSNVGAVYQKGIRTAASTVHRYVDCISLTCRIRGAYVNLIGKVVTDTGCKRHQLDKVAIVDRQLANLIATDDCRCGRCGQFDGYLIRRHCHNLIDITSLERDVDCAPLIHIELEIGLHRFLEARCFYGH